MTTVTPSVTMVCTADVAELVDALDLGSSVFGVRVRVSSSAYTETAIADCSVAHPLIPNEA